MPDVKFRMDNGVEMPMDLTGARVVYTDRDGTVELTVTCTFEGRYATPVIGVVPFLEVEPPRWVHPCTVDVHWPNGDINTVARSDAPACSRCHGTGKEPTDA